MPVTELGSFEIAREPLGLHNFVNKTLQEFCERCDRFIRWQYQEIISGDPSPEQQESHRQELKWALRTAKLLECVASDPDTSSTAALALLRAKVWQLERSWKMLYNPIPEAEADRMLRDIFPDEPRKYWTVQFSWPTAVG
jgi:hypothetical protein